MKLNRRNFIALLLGGAAGINITPLPWKLTDDIAIWTQNWPWVPVPTVGEVTRTKSFCTLCTGGCGIEVRKVDHRAVKIEGRTDYPVNPGGICPLGMGGLQLLYNADIRFPGPMKRVGPRGSGKFAEISWDEALEIVSARLRKLRGEGRPQALAAIDGNRTHSAAAVLMHRLLTAVGSPNYMRMPSSEDTFWMASVLMQGTEGPMAYDLENADFILSFGCGLLEGWGAPGRIFNAWGLFNETPLKKQTRVFQIESRASNTASKADQWIGIRPGTEAALALGLAHVIIKDGLYDRNFVKRHCFGFNDWTTSDGKKHTGFKNMVLARYSPAQVQKITGLKPEALVSLARDFAGAKSPLAISGKGKGALPGSLYECMSLLALNALVGKINVPGGSLVHEPLPLKALPDVLTDGIAQEGLDTPRLDQAGSMRFPFARNLVNQFTESVLDGDRGMVDTLLVLASNPAYTLPDGGAFAKALKKIPFIVSFSPWRDETANMADLILPDHTYLEKMDEVVWPSGLQYPVYALTQPVVEPVYRTRSSGDVLIRLARGVDDSVREAFPWEDFETVLKERTKGLHKAGGGLMHYDGETPVWDLQRKGLRPKPKYDSFDDMWDALASGGFWYQPGHGQKRWDRLFKTPTGKFEFYSTQIELAVFEYAQKTSEAKALEAMGVRATGDMVFMPHYEALSSYQDRSAYPLIMVPFEVINLSSGWAPNPPYLNKTLFDHQLRKDDSFAELNPETAEKYNLMEGDRVVVQSPAGRLSARVTLFDGAMPGVVYLLQGLGHAAYDEFWKGKGANPNHIIRGLKDPLSGQPVWWETPVELIKA